MSPEIAELVASLLKENDEIRSMEKQKIDFVDMLAKTSLQIKELQSRIENIKLDITQKWLDKYRESKKLEKSQWMLKEEAEKNAKREIKDILQPIEVEIERLELTKLELEKKINELRAEIGYKKRKISIYTQLAGVDL